MNFGCRKQPKEREPKRFRFCPGVILLRVNQLAFMHGIEFEHN